MSDSHLLKFGSSVRELRLKKGLSQEKLALETSMDLTSINEIEKGHRNPTLRTVIKIARALNVKVKDLIPF